MGIQELLDSLRRDFPGCATVAFGDLSADLVLCVSARQRPPQEQLDRLIRHARTLLDGPAAQEAGLALSGDAAGRPDLALVETAGELRLYLRAPAEPADALCCLCSAEVEIDRMIAAARTLLEAIGGKAQGGSNVEEEPQA